MSTGARNFETLDALRGVAALGVLFFHEPTLGSAWFPGGYLAVDLFFMLSGFVISHAYTARMAAGLAVRDFLQARAIRLWPMLAIGAALGIALHGGHAASLFLLPDWRSPGNLFPSNPPLWSLMFEVLAYLAFALGGWRLGSKALAAIAIASLAVLAALAANSAIPPSDFGAHWSTLWGGLARIGFGFAGGMLLQRLWRRHAYPGRKTAMGWLPLAVLIAVMALVPPDASWSALAAIAVVFPAVIWLGLRWEVPQSALARFLGAISYPLYCVHVPLLAWLVTGPQSAGIALLALPFLSLVLERMADRPARAWLAAMLAGQAKAQSSAPATTGAPSKS